MRRGLHGLLSSLQQHGALRRKERFPWLAHVALALWVLPMVAMVG